MVEIEKVLQAKDFSNNDVVAWFVVFNHHFDN